jgi:glycosyltransferase involved in cell wall biosynthesis
MQGKKLLTLPGRVTRLKGHEDFIHVIASLTKSDQSIHGVIVGGVHPNKKRFAAEIKHLIDSLNLQEHVTFVGHRSDLKDVLALSTVVFSLSSAPEAFGRTTIEALSLGTPVIGYAHGGVKEQLEHILPEGMVPVGSIQTAVEKTNEWLSNPPTPSKKHPFTLDTMCSKTIELYMK